MPELDVSDAILAPEFIGLFNVIRRTETIGQNGRSQVVTQPYPGQIGVIFPSGDNSLIRQEDQQHSRKTISVVTKFRLQMNTTAKYPGGPTFQPDLVVWNRDFFVVRSLQDYAQWGAGFVLAECTSIDSQDYPPDTSQIGQF